MRKFLSFTILFVFAAFLSAQNVNLQNGPFQFNCGSGILYDSGGPGAPYSNNENIVMTICPPLGSGQGIYLEVLVNAMGPGDTITLFDGGGVTSPVISTIPQPGVPEFQAGAIFQTSVLNTEGCMTVRFVSDGTGTGNFAYNMICGTKCQEIVSVLNTTPPQTFDPLYNGNYINVCLGDTLFANASAIFPQNEISYIQSEATSNFVWNWGDNEPVDTFQNGFHVFQNPGGYVAQLSVFDNNGCRNYQDQVFLVRVAPEPEFNSTWDSLICLGQTANLLGLPAGVFDGGLITGGTEYFIPPFYTGDTTFIPDGTGSSHISSTFVTGFENSAVIENCGFVVEMCMQLEHSYSGDLNIVLRCPNGQQVNILSFPTGTGSTNFGEPFASGPVDGVTSDPTPGVPYEYCFSDVNNNFGTLRSTTGVSYTYTTVPSQINGNTFTYTDTHFPPGTYLPEQAFSSLVGCPINGEWRLIFTDNLGADNGWLFNWTLDIHPCMYPDIDSFTMVYDLGFWDADPTIVANPSVNEIVVQPTVPGSINTYTYTVFDNFGCSYSTTYDVRVRNIFTETFGDTAVCLGDTVNFGVNILGSDVEADPTCVYTFNLFDSFGDGWNGANIVVLLDGVPTTLTPPISGFTTGSSYISTFVAGNGQTITLNYTGGTFPSENSYTLRDPNGVIIYNAPQPAPTGNGVFTTTANCGAASFTAFPLGTNVTFFDTICDLRVNMFDSFGDGWNGSNLAVSVNGSPTGQNITLASGSTGNATIPLNLGDVVALNYSPGSWEGEVSYNIQDATGTQLFAAGPNPPQGNVFNFTVSINNCVINETENAFVLYGWEPASSITDINLNGLTSSAEAVITNSTTYEVTIVMSNGCEFTDQVQIGLITFDYTLSNDTSVCDGQSVQLIASGSDSYEWTLNNETLSATDIPNPIASPIQTTTYYVVLDSAGCATLDSVQVVVNPNPEAEINGGQNPVDFCQGTSAELSATDNAGWTYGWSGPETGAGSVINVTTPGNYIVAFTDLNGCIGSATVTVAQLDTALFDFVDLQNILCCNDDEVTFNVSSFITNGLGLSDVFFNGILEEGDIVVFSAGSSATETYTLNVVSVNGCESNAALSFETRCINPEIAPVDTIFSFTSDTFNLSHNNFDNSNFTYEWSVDNLIAGNFVDAEALNGIFLASEIEGIYTANVNVSGNYTLNNGNNYICVESAEELFEVVLVSEPKFPDAFTPNGDGLNDVFIPVLDPLSTLTQFRVYNRWNQIVYEYSAGSNGWDGTFNGKAQNSDVYTYYCEIEKPDEVIVKQGTVTLIR